MTREIIATNGAGQIFDYFDLSPDGDEVHIRHKFTETPFTIHYPLDMLYRINPDIEVALELVLTAIGANNENEWDFAPGMLYPYANLPTTRPE